LRVSASDAGSDNLSCLVILSLSLDLRALSSP
jgi:hypothetical protein